MDEATAALVGAAVGALGTGAVAVTLEGLRWRREDQREQRALQAAARLVSAEFATAEAFARAAQKYRSWTMLRGLSTVAWDAFADRLSGADLTPHEYLAVINAAVKIRAAAITEGVPMPSPTTGALELEKTTAALVNACRAGREALAPYVGPEGMPEWRDDPETAT